MNGVRVLTESDWQRIALRVQNEFVDRFIVTGACENTPANLSLLPIYNGQIGCGSCYGVQGTTNWTYNVKYIISTFPGYELYFGNSLAMVGKYICVNEK